MNFQIPVISNHHLIIETSCQKSEKSQKIFRIKNFFENLSHIDPTKNTCLWLILFLHMVCGLVIVLVITGQYYSNQNLEEKNDEDQTPTYKIECFLKRCKPGL